MKKIKELFATLVVGAGTVFTAGASGNDVAIKTNLLYDATLTVNLGAEVAVAPRLSDDLSGNLNAWTLSGGKRWKHRLLQPEARYWFCDAIAGHFVGAHLLGGQYNVGALSHGFEFLGTNFKNLENSRYQGWFAGAGIAYGYSWMLGKHWNLEAEIGVGYIYTRFDRYPCTECGSKLEEGRHHNYVGPTKAAINLVYVF